MTARFFIVGDIHACPQELETLLSALALQPADRVVFLGDYIDRGPGAREVIEVLLGLQAEESCQLTFLKGNHDDMFLDFLGYGGCHGDAFLRNGGGQTLLSYGCDPAVAGTELTEQIPETHRQFFRSLDLYFSAGDVLCVHAGVDPGRPLVDQSPEDLLWIRTDFIDKPHPLPYTIVYGHTPQREVRFALPYAVGIDTGLVYGGKLSCFEWTEKVLFQVAKGSQQPVVTALHRHWDTAA